MKEEIEAAGVIITPGNKKEIDRLIHEVVEVAYKNCSPAWQAVKARIRDTPEERSAFIEAIRKRCGNSAG